jgi:hypothetical protein
MSLYGTFYHFLTLLGKKSPLSRKKSIKNEQVEEFFPIQNQTQYIDLLNQGATIYGNDVKCLNDFAAK